VLKIYGSTGSIEHVIEAGSDKTHRIEVTPDGAKLYPENEEDTFSSVIDLKAREGAQAHQEDIRCGRLNNYRGEQNRQMSGDDSEDQALDREPRNLLYEKAFGGGEIQPALLMAGATTGTGIGLRRSDQCRSR
jgi:hypothetical protein